jgi:hypothetical protein
MIITARRQEEQTLLVRAVDDVLGTHSAISGLVKPSIGYVEYVICRLPG